jgi:DNA-binding transcriptional ArsR family regulator
MPKPTLTNQKFRAQVFHALSASERLEIIEFLRDGEKCVCEVVPRLKLIQPVVSRHLKILRDVGVIKCRKDGTKRMYSLVEPKILDVADVLTPDLVSILQKEVVRQRSCNTE